MGTLRNFIDITGITPEEELPKKVNGQIVQYSEIDYIFVPDDRQGISSIFQIFIDVEIKSRRTINAPLGKIVVLDGVKKIKLIYTQKYNEGKVGILALELPYNTFIELPKDAGEIKNISVNIVDAYFSLIESKKVYSNILYMISVNYDKESINEINNDTHSEIKCETCEEVPNETKNETKKEDNSEIVLSSIVPEVKSCTESKKDFEKKHVLVDINEEYL